MAAPTNFFWQPTNWNFPSPGRTKKKVFFLSFSSGNLYVCTPGMRGRGREIQRDIHIRNTKASFRRARARQNDDDRFNEQSSLFIFLFLSPSMTSIQQTSWIILSTVIRSERINLMTWVFFFFFSLITGWSFKKYRTRAWLPASGQNRRQHTQVYKPIVMAAELSFLADGRAHSSRRILFSFFQSWIMRRVDII